MRKLHILGLALVAVFAFSSLAAASAFAESEWLVDSAAVTTATNVELTGTLQLEDVKAGTELECTGKGTGTILGKTDTQVTAEATSCVTLKGLCGEPLAVAKNLPWATTIELVGTEFRDLIASGGKGAPGYDVTCFKIVEDTCSGTTSVGLENMPSESPPDVLAIFSRTLSEAGTCTVGGAGQGLIEGQLLVTAGGLSVAVS